MSRLNLTRPDGTKPEDLHLTRRSAAGMVFVGYAVAMSGAQAKPIITPESGLTIEEVLVPNGEPSPLPAYLARPAKPGPHPTIIVVNEIVGIHDYIKDVCRRFARLGYVAIAPAFFYRLGVDLPAMTDVQEILKLVERTTDAEVDGDMRATIAWLQGRSFVAPKKMGVTGFCWGGAVVWRTAMLAPALRAGVAWYGRLGTIIPRAGELEVPVLGLYAGKDQGIPLREVDEMRAVLKATHNKGSEIVVYPEATHGFHADYRPSYDPAAATDAWKRALAYFQAHGVG